MSQDPTTPVDLARQAARLAHDVGKYVARTARNLPPSGASAALISMLATDLYALARGRRASAIFDELAGPLEREMPDPRLAAARGLLAEVDSLEERLRAGDAEAVTRGAALALEVESLLRALARSAREAARTLDDEVDEGHDRGVPHSTRRGE